MKGTKMFPQCGFSNSVVQILRSMNVPFESVGDQVLSLLALAGCAPVVDELGMVVVVVVGCALCEIWLPVLPRGPAVSTSYARHGLAGRSRRSNL